MTHRGSINHAIQRDDKEVIVRVAYVYWPASRGLFERGGLQITPDDPAELEITSSVDIATGREVVLTEQEEESVWNAVGEQMSEDNREYERQ